MPWCPKCKEEYKDGILVCPDCGVELVDKLETEDERKNAFSPVFTFDTKELAEKFASYLNYSGIMAVQEETKDNTVTISVREKDIKKAKKHFSAFYSVEATNALVKDFEDMKEANDNVVPSSPFDWDKNAEVKNEFLEDEDTPQQELENDIEEMMPSGEAYEKRSDKASDSYVTAIMFFVFGILGLILELLSALKIITFFGGPIFYIVGTLIFLGFLYIGWSTFKSYKKYKAESAQEEELTKGLLDWLKENFTKETVQAISDRVIAGNKDASSEIIYFHVNSEMKSMIVKQFGEIDDAYLDYITDEYYNKYLADDTDKPETEEE